MAIKKKNRYKTDMKYNLRVFFSLMKNYKGIIIFLIVVSTLLEASKAVDKFLLKIIIDNGTNFVAGTLARIEFVNILLIVAISFIGLAILSFLARWIHVHLVIKLSADMILDLKRKFFNYLIHLSHSFHTSHKTGSLISRLIRGGWAVDNMVDVLVFSVFPLILQIIIVTITLIYYSVSSVITIMLIVIVFLTYSLALQFKQIKDNVRANQIEDTEKANISDIFTNIDSIKYFGKENMIKAKFAKLSETTRKGWLKSWSWYSWMDSGQAFILAIGTFFIVYFPLVQLLNEEMSIGTLVFIYTMYGNVFWPLFSFVHGIRQFYKSMADFDALFQYGKIEIEVKDRIDAKELEIKQGEIEFDNVSFNYEKRKIFRNFSLKILKTKKVALVGHSGSGKTTLVKLLYRFYDVNAGAILIDGRDIEEFKQESLRAEMSVVPQEAILFDDTIYNNVAFSSPKASKQEVMRAMKFAQLDKVIKDFPKKENTIVGERGVKLSGGEKQRVSIARAILANKKVLILDEATSSLDSETESEIQKDLQKLMEGRTSIIIAHRLSTIMRADTIVVLKKGKIVQIGSHNQLIKEEGEYRKLWNLQKGGYIK